MEAIDEGISQKGFATDSNLNSNVNKSAMNLKKVKQNKNIEQSDTIIKNENINENNEETFIKNIIDKKKKRM